MSVSAIIQTRTTDLQASIDFYTTLNFQLLSSASPTLLTDGKIILEINPDRYARAGIQLYRADWEPVVDQLKDRYAISPLEKGYLLSDPSGCWIYLMNGTSGVSFDLSGTAFGVLGNCAGLTLETTEIARSVALWEGLGFSQTMGGIEQGWITYTDPHGTVVSLMKPLVCPHAFYNPSLSYFNGKNNLSVIEKIRELDIPITEEIAHFNQKGIVDNIIIRDPGGLGFFIFSD
ncbi:MAG: hypothetical protein AAGD05_15690 [Bacteroidota bacterium]